jgi:two-component system CheB/CheR fusion protein
MRNLLNSVDEATIFLDIDWKIRRYTPQTERIMSLLPGDVGRPIQDIAMKLRYEDLVPDVKEVLDTLNTKEKEVQTKDGQWYKLKILPYRTIDNVIDGVVLTFNDISSQKKVQEKLKELTLDARSSQEYAESIVNTVREPLLILGQNLNVLSANASFLKRFKTKPENIVGRPMGEILDGIWNDSPLIGKLKDLGAKDSLLENFSVEVASPKGRKVTMEITARKLLIPSGKSSMILMSIDMKE